MAGEVQVRVDGSLHVVVRGGGKAALALALRAAQATVARDSAHAYVLGEDGALWCQQRAAMKATPQQLRQIAERLVSRGRRAVSMALRKAGYQVEGPAPVTLRIDAAGGMFVSGGGEDARTIALHAACVSRTWGDRSFDFVAEEGGVIRCQPASKEAFPKAPSTRAISPKATSPRTTPRASARARAAAAKKGSEAALRALRAAGHRVKTPPIVKVRVDKALRIVVSGGDDDARGLALEAARTARASDGRFSFVADARGAICCRPMAAFRATAEQLARMVQEWVESGRKAAVEALQEAGYQVTGPGST